MKRWDIEDDLLVLYEQFRQSPYGQTLESRIRYSPRKPPGMSNHEWEELLGPDVNNLKHALVTLEIAKDFISSEETGFKEEDCNAVLLAAVVHDWGEAVVGDVPFGKKTAAGALEERQILAEIGEEYIRKANKEWLLPLFRRLVLETLDRTDTDTGKAFNVIERVGYLRTSLRAWEISQGACQLKDAGYPLYFQWLTYTVFANQMAAFVAYANAFNYASIELRKNESAFTGAFENISPAVLDLYPADEVEAKRQAFQKAKEAWREYVVSSM